MSSTCHFTFISLFRDLAKESFIVYRVKLQQREKLFQEDTKAEYSLCIMERRKLHILVIVVKFQKKYLVTKLTNKRKKT